MKYAKANSPNAQNLFEGACVYKPGITLTLRLGKRVYLPGDYKRKKTDV
jgi:hypothetical protein